MPQIPNPAGLAVLKQDRALIAVQVFARQTLAPAGAELQKLSHDAVDVVTRAIQPALWLLLFGKVMSHLRELATPDTPYLDFLAPGILAQSVLFVAIFYGISAIWERDLGVIQRYLVSPAPRTALVLGKALSASVRALIQAVIVYAISMAMAASVNLGPTRLLGTALLIILASGLFATLSLIIACLVKTRERFMGIGQVLTMPIFFASNAIYPLSLMPPWLQTVARFNPLTYEVDALRALMLTNGTSSFGIPFDFAVLAAVFTILIVIAARLYPRLAT